MRFDPKVYSTSNLFKPDLDDLRPYLEDVSSGIIVSVFETRFAEYHSSKHCIAFSTGFWALVSSILAKTAASPSKKHVLMPSMTYRRLADVVNWCGLTPKFVDIDKKSLAISSESVKKNVDDNTALIMAVHPIVNCCDVEALISVSNTLNVPILFDAVESVHETVNGKRIGSFGVGEVFSLHASKLINGIEGGYVCTDDDAFSTRLRMMLASDRNGECVDYIQSDIHPMHCAYALASLDRIGDNVCHNRSVYYAYRDLLKNNPYLKLVEFCGTEETSYKNVVVEVLDSCPINRGDFVSMLNEIGINCRAHYFPALHEKATHYNKIVTDLTVTNSAKKMYVNLPCGQRLSESFVINVVGEINRLLGL